MNPCEDLFRNLQNVVTYSFFVKRKVTVGNMVFSNISRQFMCWIYDIKGKETHPKQWNHVKVIELCSITTPLVSVSTFSRIPNFIIIRQYFDAFWHFMLPKINFIFMFQFDLSMLSFRCENQLEMPVTRAIYSCNFDECDV